MVSHLMNGVRAAAFAVALLGLSGTPLLAQATQCGESAIGEQTGDSYDLIGQSVVTVELEITAGGSCVGSVGSKVTETYNVGYYKNTRTGSVAKVNCSSGKVLGWL